MRAAWVDTMNVFFGPSSPYGVPNFQYVTAKPCRYVPQTQIDEKQFPFTLTAAWVTYATPALNGPQVMAPWVPATFEDYKTSDQVTISSVPGVRWAVVGTQFVHPTLRPSYYRSRLMDVTAFNNPPWLPPSPLPPPPPPVVVCPVAGTSCATAGVVPLGTTCPYATVVGFSLWLRFPVAPTTLYTRVATQTAGSQRFNWWHGNNCGTMTPVTTHIGSQTAPYLSGPAPSTLWVNITGLPTITSTSTVRVF